MLKVYLHTQASVLCITGYYQIFENFWSKIIKKYNNFTYDIASKLGLFQESKMTLD